MSGDRPIGGYFYRIVHDGTLWRVSRIDGACSRWEALPSGRYRHWRSEAAATAYVDSLAAIAPYEPPTLERISTLRDVQASGTHCPPIPIPGMGGGPPGCP